MQNDLYDLRDKYSSQIKNLGYEETIDAIIKTNDKLLDVLSSEERFTERMMKKQPKEADRLVKQSEMLLTNALQNSGQLFRSLKNTIDQR